ncbi:hypothetical protein CDD82_4481 [Ophiocordyceps australis]|uniref:Heterokaryon incompatibility domain-containing protein n=1 Tax=Ophiocordyceps australis TaxID=1399860 RepID=A0A2C5XKA6_9HYPO|nr:hypothetical protein CDD82_4481 [Ophiocordyceps australis]
MRQRCKLCDFWGVTEEDLVDLRNEELDYFSFLTIEKEKAERPVFRVDVYTNQEKISWCSLREDTGRHPVFEESNNGPQTWSTIDTWMSTCLESHNRCNKTEPLTQNPTRLLKINTLRSPYTFRLTLGSDCPDKAQYLALSYCWGSGAIDDNLRLLKETEEQLSQEQPVDILPRTFRDAIGVAKHFQVDYIWIDRLCIPQDSVQDWHREASSMQTVYKNAYVGICALSAQDDNSGCFFTREPARVRKHIVRLKPQESGAEEELILNCPRLRSEWSHFFRDEAAIQRAWIFQERLLAPRTLYFGRDLVFWECRETSCCEIYPKGIPQHHSDVESLRHPPLWKNLLEVTPRGGGNDPCQHLMQYWYDIIEEYSKLKLSHGCDKLVAVSGLANDMQAELQQLSPGPHHYLAGLWEETLIESLDWKSRDNESERCSQFRAPSWSWACLDGAVAFSWSKRNDSMSLTRLASLVSVEMTHKDTGEMTSGVLTLRGPRAVAQVHEATKEKKKYLLSRIQMPDDGHHVRLESEHDSIVWFDTLGDVVKEFHILWLLHNSRVLEDAYVSGIALLPVAENTFRRVGWSKTYCSEKDKTDLIGQLPIVDTVII